MPGKANVGVGKDHALERRVVEIASVRALDLRLVVAPVAVDGEDHTTDDIGARQVRRTGRERAGRKGRTRDYGARGL